MTESHVPLADMAVSIQSVSASSNLTLSGIDLDSGQTIQIQIAGVAMGDLVDQLRPTKAGLVLILTLYSDGPLHAA